jgi:hypothetical protein
MAKEVKKAVAKKAKVLPKVFEMVQAMQESCEYILKDCDKFDNGTNAAGARIRKAMQEIKVNCKEVRDAVTEIKTSRKEG